MSNYETIGKGFFYKHDGPNGKYCLGTIEVVIDGQKMVMQAALFPTKSVDAKASFVLNVNSIQNEEAYRQEQAERKAKKQEKKKEEEEDIPF